MRLQSLVFVASILLTTLATAEWHGASSDSDVAIIIHYVTSRKHWPARSFRIERKNCDCAYALYRIIYIPEDGKPITAYSKSFAVHYDEQLHRVVKETQFQ